MTVGPRTVMPAGDLSQGLQYPDEINVGFPQLAAGPTESESDLADAASVAEAALAFSLQPSDDLDPG